LVISKGCSSSSWWLKSLNNRWWRRPNNVLWRRLNNRLLFQHRRLHHHRRRRGWRGWRLYNHRRAWSLNHRLLWRRWWGRWWGRRRWRRIVNRLLWRWRRLYYRRRWRWRWRLWSFCFYGRRRICGWGNIMLLKVADNSILTKTSCARQIGNRHTILRGCLSDQCRIVNIGLNKG
jgi:hypothetical protein